MRCAKCQAPITKDTRFCTGCGDALPWTKSAGAGHHPPILPDDVDLGKIAQLNEEKQRLTGELEELLQIAAERDATPEEQQRYTHLRALWKEVGEEITKQMGFLSARQEHGRREFELRRSQRRMERAALDLGETGARDERRSGAERRDDERRHGTDRRNRFPKTTL